MKLEKVYFDINSFGITQRSLKILRDTLAERSKNHIAVVEVPTNDLCCGFFIFDKDLREAVWTGDGFRTDRCGEGGSGYRSAEALFMLYRIRPLFWDTIDFGEVYVLKDSEKIEAFIFSVASGIFKDLEPGDFVRISDRDPYYVRNFDVIYNGEPPRVVVKRVN